MTTTTKGHPLASDDVERGVNAPTTPAPAVEGPDDSGATSPEHEGEPKTYDEAYVSKLREEAAANRVRAKRAEEAETRLRTLAVEAAVRGVLQDPTDLAWSEEYADDDGWPDDVRIREAAEELAQRKPHLGRPGGDVGQGRHSDDQERVSLVGLLKAGA
jgi:hypothetical protein